MKKGSKKKRHRIFAAFLCFCMLFTMLGIQNTSPVVEAAEGQGWALDGNGKLTIESDAGMTDWITNGISSNTGNVKSVKINSGVTSIGDKAFFNCRALTSAEIPDSVNSIGSNVFWHCSALTSVNIPFGVTSIKDQTFDSCGSLKSIEIPDSVTSIESRAFAGCSGLESVTIPDSVTSIKGQAFSGCSGLTNIKLSNSVTSIENTTFSGCRGLTSIEIPNSVTSIGSSAFSNCQGLTSIEIPFGVTSIGFGAFSGCSDLRSVMIPKSVTSIGAEAFRNCSSLTEITIPNSVTSIENWTFHGCSGLGSVTIPESVRSIGGLAFYGCKGLTNIEIPSGVTSIKWGTFCNCSGLTSIGIPSNVTSIEGSAFEGCSGLSSVTIPESVVNIGEKAFYNCTKLIKVDMRGKNPPTLETNSEPYPFPEEESTGAFDNSLFVKEKKKGILVPVGTVGDYTSAEGWSDYADYITDGRPEITMQPDNRTVQNGNTATFSVTAKGEGTISYQWQVDKNNGTFVNIDSAASSTYTTPAVDLNYNGYKYQCVVGNDRGEIVSNRVTLTVTESDADKVAAVKNVVVEALAGYTATNDTTKESVQNVINTALSDKGITGVTVTVGELKKREATKSEPGSVIGNVSIVSANDSSVTDSVTINKIIEKLPKTEAEKVADAKKVVEETLAGITARNETTKDDIQRVIDAVLKDAEITDVKVTVGDLTKTVATTDAEGSISGSITIVSANDSGVTDSVTIGKTIARHEHIWKWIITKEATAEQEGEMTGTCICGVEETEVIPKTGVGGGGTVTVKDDENECEASLPDKEDVKGKIYLTDAEKNSLKSGEDVEIILRLEDVKLAADTPQKEAILNKKGTNALGTFLDIKLLKKIGKDEPIPITETTDKIKVSFEIPERLRNTDNTITRTYQIMRNHGGVVDILNVESYDKVSHLLTFKTDKFSTYALVYRDTKAIPKPTETDNKSIRTDAERVARAKGIVEKVLSEMPVTNDTIKESIQKAVDDALREAGISDVTVVVGDLTKNPATVEVDGSLTGVVVVQKGSVSESVSISKTIPKLPEDDIIKPQQQEKNDITMMAGTKVSQTGKEISVSWGEIKEADGYYVYVAYCGEDFNAKPSKVVKSDSPTKVSVKKINGKKLNLKRNYKVYVAAYKTVDGKKVVIGKTLICHIVGKNNHAYTNVKQVKLEKSEFTLKAGETAKINARTVLVDKKKKQLSNAHAKEFRYTTCNKEVAAVSKQGKIKAVGKGSCIIYVYARNGYAKKITVKVE